MGYYLFNQKEVSQKAKENYFKEKSAEYYLKKQRSNKKSKNIDTETWPNKKKTRLKSIKEKDISN